MASEDNPQIVLAGVVSFKSNVQIYFTLQEKLKKTLWAFLTSMAYSE